MFEKESEEYEERKHYRYEDNDYCGDIADGIIQAFQTGAEFGYNKAKEEMQVQLAISEHDREHNDYELAEAYKKIAELKALVENIGKP